jgi:hypothetical protein
MKKRKKYQDNDTIKGHQPSARLGTNRNSGNQKSRQMNESNKNSAKNPAIGAGRIPHQPESVKSVPGIEQRTNP